MMWTPPERIRHPLPQARWPSREEAAQSLLFSPIQVGPVQLESRTWVPAMVPWRATVEGVVTANVLEWYERFAAGRPGAIVVEATGIRDVPSGPLLRIGHDRFVPGLRELVETVRRASGGHTRLLIQLIDFLAVRRRPDAAAYFARFLNLTRNHRDKLVGLTGDLQWAAASDGQIREFLRSAADEVIEGVLDDRELESLRYGYRERVTDTHLDHVRCLPDVLPETFASAAQRAQSAGFDGVELHYAHAYTMASFLSATNDRADGYGGSRENRVRLPLEVYQAVRQSVGRDFVVGARFLGDEAIKGGSSVEDAAYYGVQFARAGMDFLSISKGGKFDDAKQPKVGEAVYPYTGRSGYECMPTVISDQRGPFGRNVNLAAEIRAAVRKDGYEVPVITAGGLATYEQCESVLRNGEADIVAAARQSLADPDWFLKLRLGRGDEIRRCHFTNYCEALDQMHKQVTCKLWDRVKGDESAVPLSDDGRRRLLAPSWSADGLD